MLLIIVKILFWIGFINGSNVKDTFRNMMSPVLEIKPFDLKSSTDNYQSNEKVFSSINFLNSKFSLSYEDFIFETKCLFLLKFFSKENKFLKLEFIPKLGFTISWNYFKENEISITGNDDGYVYYYSISENETNHNFGFDVSAKKIIKEFRCWQKDFEINRSFSCVLYKQTKNNKSYMKPSIKYNISKKNEKFYITENKHIDWEASFLPEFALEFIQSDDGPKYKYFSNLKLDGSIEHRIFENVSITLSPFIKTEFFQSERKTQENPKNVEWKPIFFESIIIGFNYSLVFDISNHRIVKIFSKIRIGFELDFSIISNLNLKHSFSVKFEPSVFKFFQ